MTQLVVEINKRPLALGDNVFDKWLDQVFRVWVTSSYLGECMLKHIERDTIGIGCRRADRGLQNNSLPLIFNKQLTKWVYLPMGCQIGRNNLHASLRQLQQIVFIYIPTDN